MYPITSSVKALFDDEYRQTLRITGIDADGNPITITDANVMADGFTIDRFACNTTKLEVGTAVSSELTLELDNRQGQFDGVRFEGTELFVEIGIADWSQENPEVTYIPCGYFTPDVQPRALSTITLKALDRMMLFEKELTQYGDKYYWTDHNGNRISDASGNNIVFYAPVSDFPCSVESLVSQCCDLCGIELAESISGLPNANYQVIGIPELQQNVTYRNLIQWAAGLMGTNAYIDWDGKLRFSWFGNETGYVADTSNRFSGDLFENDITISGISYTDSDDTLHLAGDSYYTIDLSGNYLINTSTADSALTVLYNALHAYTYRPFSAAVVCAPYLWPMDQIVYVDRNGNGHVTTLTNVNLTVNGKTVLEAKGETDQTNTYAKPGMFTARQAEALQRIQVANNNHLNEALQNATDYITGAKGGCIRYIYDDDELSEIVILNTKNIETATKVWRWNIGGLGYSSNGYNGQYTTAITQDGSIVADFITTGELDASLATITNIDASNINTGTLNASVVDVINLDADNITTGTIDASDIAVTNIDASNITTGTIDASAITVTNIDADNITTGSIDAGVIDVTNINADNITGGTINGTNVTAKLLNIVDATDTVVASFSDSVILGKAAKGHVEVDFNSFDIFDGDGNKYLSVGDSRDAQGYTEHSETFTADGYKTIFIVDYTIAQVVSVTVNGVETTEYTKSGRRITFSSAPASGSVIVVRYKTLAAFYHYDFGTRGVEESGLYSVVEGIGNNASGTASHAEGGSTNASTPYSHAEGYGTAAIGSLYDQAVLYGCCHAEGRQTTASGYCGHSEGSSTTASGETSHAEGYQTTAGGNGAHAEGYYTTVSGAASHAEGFSTSATGSWCHAEGMGTIANHKSQHVFGEYNVPDASSAAATARGDYVEIVGRGTSDSSRSNARTLDWSGNEWIAGTLTQASDARFKDETGPVPDVSGIRAKRFVWNDKMPHDDNEHVGYFAQEVEAVTPIFVRENDEGVKSLDYIGLLCAKIDWLERRVAELEKGRNNNG